MLPLSIQRHVTKVLKVLGFSYIEETTVASGDFVLISDASDEDRLKRVPASSFSGGGSVASGTKSEYNAALTDGDFMFNGDAPTAHTHVKADITDFGTYSTDIHSNITALNAVSGVNTGDQDLSGLLVKSNNLSDLPSPSAARTSLGLGTLATQSGTFSGSSSGTNTGDQDLSGLLVKSSNLSDLTNPTNARTNLGLGTLATQNGTFSGTSSGTNTGDQTSIVGITGTKSEFNSSVTDGDIFFIDDISGTPTGQKFLRDDFSWALIPTTGNVEGGSASSVYGGTTPIDGGTSASF